MIPSIARAVAQVTVGWVFASSGWGKLQSLPKVIAYFESLGLPAAGLMGPTVASVELIAGTLVVIGLWTRPASLVLILVMVGALATALREDIEGLSSLLGMAEFLYILILGLLGAHAQKSEDLRSRWRSFRKRAVRVEKSSEVS